MSKYVAVSMKSVFLEWSRTLSIWAVSIARERNAGRGDNREDQEGKYHKSGRNVRRAMWLRRKGRDCRGRVVTMSTGEKKERDGENKDIP